MFKFPDTYNAKTLETLEYDDIIWIEHYTLQINLISNQVATLPSGENMSELADYYRSRASHLFREERYLESINDLLESYKLSMNNNILISLAFCYDKINEFDKSLEQLNKFKELNPTERYIDDYIKTISDKKLNNNFVDSKIEFDKLRDILIENNSSLDKVIIKHHNKEYREILSNNDIKQGENVLEISEKCIITTEIGKDTEIGKEVIKKNLSLISKHNWITFVLLELLRGKEKWDLWKYYLKILPKTFDTNPLFFDKYYLEYLKGSQCLNKINKRQLLILNDYDTLCENIDLMKQYTYKEYTWARTVVITRIFGIVLNGIKTQALVPYADMLNHTPVPKTRWYFDDQEKVFKIIAKNNISINEKIYDTYGRKCNSRFFVNYGFVLNHNKDNLVLFEFDKSSSYVKFLKRKKWYKFGKVSLEYSMGVSNFNNEKLNNFLSIIRYLVCDEEEYFNKSLTPFLFPISISNERSALQYLMRLCVNHLKRYSKSKSDDLKILLDPLNPYSMKYSKIRNITLICYGEKVIYEYYLQMCISSLKMLNYSFDKLMETDLLITGLSGPYREYINEHLCKLLNKNGDLDFYLNDI